MKSTFCFLLLLITSPLTLAQVTDMTCNTGVMYALEGSSVRKLQLSGSTIIDLGIISSFTGQSGGIAYGLDILTGSVNRTLYTTRFNFVTNQHDILQYDGSSWNVIFTDSTVYHNAGGYGNFIYFQHGLIPGMPNDQCISRLNSNGTLTKIFTDTSLVFTVADVVVNNQGHVFCFRGPSIGNTSQILELDPVGNVVNTFNTNLNNLTVLWGACFIGTNLYVGWNTANVQLFPVIFNGSNATLGTPVNFPAGLSFKDLTNCHDSTETTSLFQHGQSSQSVSVYPNPTADGNFTIKSSKHIKEIIVRNVLGEIVLRKSEIAADESLYLAAKGVYLIETKTDVTSYTRLLRL